MRFLNRGVVLAEQVEQDFNVSCEKQRVSKVFVEYVVRREWRIQARNGGLKR